METELTENDVRLIWRLALALLENHDWKLPEAFADAVRQQTRLDRQASEDGLLIWDTEAGRCTIHHRPDDRWVLRTVLRQPSSP